MSDAATLFPRLTAATATPQNVGRRRAEGAFIRDVILAIPDDEPLEAFVIEPGETGREQGAGPGVLFAHWFDTEAPNGDRTEFLDEAVLLAARGISSLLPQLTFPWTTDPSGAAIGLRDGTSSRAG